MRHDRVNVTLRLDDSIELIEVSKLEEALEIQSLRRIISAFLNYPAAARRDVNKYERSFEKLPPEHKALLPDYLSKCQKLRWCASINSFFILQMLQAFEPPFDINQHVDIPVTEGPGNVDRQQVQSTMVSEPETVMSYSKEHTSACSCSSICSANHVSDGDCRCAPGKPLRKRTYEEGTHLESSCNHVEEHFATNYDFRVDKGSSDDTRFSLCQGVDSVECSEKENGKENNSQLPWFDQSLQLDVPLIDVDKVRCVIRSIVRDWTEEGQRERSQCYRPILDELNHRFLDRCKSSPPSCLVPGAGLGRLALEISALGFVSQGNEFSYYMMICSSFILNHTQRAREWTIYPWVHSNCNSLSDSEQLRPVQFPDIHPASGGITEGFSMCAGDFVEVYNDPSQEGAWDSVVTCFFIDTAHNIIEYIEIISRILRDGGVWINLGPLLYHFADACGPDEMSIELSLEDVKRVSLHYGFVLEMEQTIRTTYTANPRSMMQNWYFASFWTMRKCAKVQAE